VIKGPAFRMPKGKRSLPKEEGAGIECRTACLDRGFVFCLAIRATHYLAAHNVGLFNYAKEVSSIYIAH
jgi:hypothetical protein